MELSAVVSSVFSEVVCNVFEKGSLTVRKSVIQNIENVGGIYSVNLFKYFMYLQPYKWVCKNIYKKRNVPSKECLFSRKPIPKVKVMRSKTVSRGANILIEIKSSPHPREREISKNLKPQPVSSLQKEQLKDSMEKPMIFHCGNYSRVKELLVDDPMWSSGSLSISPFGKSPKGRMDSHVSGRFLMVENTSKGSVMSSDCVRDLIMEHEKFACGNGETFSSNTNDKFKSPVVTTCRTYKESFDIKTDAIDSAMTSPWKHSPSSILNLAPYLL
ncbi:hypothetical protein Avbf_06582 [Armadillidium vulgare]|nr:hypothetical protein Avbf_06582 [Armadillidium vulgare]